MTGFMLTLLHVYIKEAVSVSGQQFQLADSESNVGCPASEI